MYFRSKGTSAAVISGHQCRGYLIENHDIQAMRRNIANPLTCIRYMLAMVMSGFKLENFGGEGQADLVNIRNLCLSSLGLATLMPTP